MEAEKNKAPVHEVRIGAIKCAIWRNEGPNGPWHSTTISRIFRDGDQWKQSGAFGRDDLLIVAKVADVAFDWIVANQKREPTE